MNPRLSVISVVSGIVLATTLTGCTAPVDASVACPISDADMEQIFGATVTSTADTVDGDGIYEGLPITSCEYVIDHDSGTVALDRIYLESVDTKSAASIGGPCFACQNPNSTSGEAHPEWSQHAWLDSEAGALSGHTYEASLEARGRYWHLNATDSAVVEPYIGDPPPDPVADQELTQLISMLDMLAAIEAPGSTPDEETTAAPLGDPSCANLSATLTALQPSTTTVTNAALADFELPYGVVLPVADCVFKLSNTDLKGGFNIVGFYLQEDQERAALIDYSLDSAGFRATGSTWYLLDDGDFAGFVTVTSGQTAFVFGPDVSSAAGGVGDTLIINFRAAD